MSSETSPHEHHCHCGTTWLCSKPDCRLDDECTNCELATFEAFAEAHCWTDTQLVLPELAHPIKGI